MTKIRWQMAWLLGLGVLISYFDRLNMSVASGAIQASYNLSFTDMGLVLSSYLWSYALMQVPVGALLDRYGVRRLLGGACVLWALATLCTPLAGRLSVLILARLVLGVAEAPAFPGAAKAVSLWFPREERGLATSAFDAAAKFSNVVGLPLISQVVVWSGWQAGFWLTGCLTLLYALLFWTIYRDPVDHPTVSHDERAYIAAGGGQQEALTAPPMGEALRYLLTQPRIWGLILGFGAYGYSFYLLILWLPGYLGHEFHMNLMQGGWMAAIPWLVATVTDIFIGGWLVDTLIARGWDGARVRKGLLVLGMFLGLAVVGAAFTRDVWVAITWISIALGGLAFAAPIGWSLPGLVAPPELVGTVGSLMNLSNNLMGAIAPVVTGYIVARTGSFAAAFGLAGIILVFGILSFWLLLGRVEQLPSLATADGR